VTIHLLLEWSLLGFVVLLCWLGVLGMWRMRQPVQALHYLSMPACGATVALTIAVFLKTGNTQAGWKTLLICFVLLAINSVVTHATARAFRVRELGHWPALPGDPVEFVRDRSDQ
jgi:multisubunit Na+/H+ antiporter MnhG subunit